MSNIRRMLPDDVDAVWMMDRDLEKNIVTRWSRDRFEITEGYVLVEDSGELKGFICLKGNRVTKLVSNGGFGVAKRLIDFAIKNNGKLTAMIKQNLVEHYKKLFGAKIIGIRPHAYGVGDHGTEIVVEKLGQ